MEAIVFVAAVAVLMVYIERDNDVWYAYRFCKLQCWYTATLTPIVIIIALFVGFTLYDSYAQVTLGYYDELYVQSQREAARSLPIEVGYNFVLLVLFLTTLLDDLALDVILKKARAHAKKICTAPRE